MALSSAPYSGFLLGLPQGQFNLVTGPVRIALVGSSYVPDMVGDVFLSDVNDILAGTEKTLTGVTLTYNEDTFAVTATAASATWQTLTLIARWAVLYLGTGTASTSRLIGYLDFVSAREFDAEDLTLTFTTGFAKIPAV